MVNEPMDVSPQTQPKNQSLMTGVALIALVVIVALGAVAYNSSNNPPASSGTNSSPTIVGNDANNAAMATAFKNGEYEAVGKYQTPGGETEVGVTLTLDNGVVTAVDVEKLATVPISQKFQDEFIASYKEQVIGKKINELQLSKVSGSSLTPKGFNDALEKIKTQAST